MQVAAVLRFHAFFPLSLFRRPRRMGAAVVLCGLIAAAEWLVCPVASAQSTSPKPGAFGGFASAPTYSVPVIDSTVDSISSVAAADLNGDGKADAVVGLTDGIAILLNNGSGQLTNTSTISLVPSPKTLAVSYQHVLVAIGDMNGDGKPDMAATVNGEVWVLLNQGGGTFTAPSTPYSPGPGAVLSLTIADVTGDGKPDITLLLPDSVTVMQGHGDGTFSPFVALSNGVGNLLPVQEYWSDGIGDVNGDGKPDLVATGFVPGVCNPSSRCAGTTSEPDIEGFTENDNSGNGNFGPAIPYPQTAGNPYGTYGTVAIADVNHDGLPDIVLGTNNVSSGVNSITVAINQGNAPSGISQVGGGSFPQFNNPQAITTISSGLLDDDLPSPIVLNPNLGKPLNAFGLSIMTADFNGDGYPDLVVNDNNNGTLISLQNNKDNTFTAVATVPGGVGMSPMTMADFNGDGIPDVLVANAGTNTVSVLVGEGGGIYNAAQSFPILATSGNSSEAVNVLTTPGITTPGLLVNNGNVIADFNGDGVPDYVYSDSNGNVHEQISSAKGYSYTDNALVVSPLGGSKGPVQIILANDFDGDGKQDLLLQYGGKFGVALGQGDGTFVVPSIQNSYAHTTSGLGGFVVADVNGDGKPDVLATAPYLSCVATPGSSCGTYTGTMDLAVFLGNGDGTFQTPNGFLIDDENYEAAFAVGDVTVNGIPDLVVSASSGLSVWAGDGTGSFSQSLLITQTTPGAPVIGDFNGDGSNDIAALGSKEITILFNDGKGNFPASLAELVPTSIGSNLHAVDVNRDGLTDLVMLSGGTSPCWDVEESCETGTSSVLTLLSTGAGAFKSYYFPINDPVADSGAFQVLDVNGDGAADVVVATQNELTSIFYNQTVAAVSLSPKSLTFPGQATGTTSAAQTVTLTNPGQAALSITSISASAGFAETNTCGSSVAAGANCTIAVTFTPTTAGNQTGTVTITDNASGSPQTVALSGAGVAPAAAATVSPASLTFAAQATGSTSTVQTVTLTNSGSTPLAIASLSSSGDFAETNTCGNSVAAGANCTISVTFNPTVAGSRTGTLTITDNASGSPQTVSLSGMGTSFTVSALSSALAVSSQGGSSTATIQLQSADGFAGTANLTCSVAFQGQGTPADAPTCGLNPSQATLASGATVSATLTVSTTAASSSALSGPDWKGGWKTSGGVLAAMLFFGFVPRRRRGLAMLALLCMVGFGVVAGCGGGGSTAGGGNNPAAAPGTTTGSYTVTVKAASGTVTASTTIPLSVQ